MTKSTQITQKHYQYISQSSIHFSVIICLATGLYPQLEAADDAIMQSTTGTMRTHINHSKMQQNTK